MGAQSWAQLLATSRRHLRCPVDREEISRHAPVNVFENQVALLLMDIPDSLLDEAPAQHDRIVAALKAEIGTLKDINKRLRSELVALKKELREEIERCDVSQDRLSRQLYAAQARRDRLAVFASENQANRVTSWDGDYWV